MVIVESHISGHRRSWCVKGTEVTTNDVLDLLKEREGQDVDVVLQQQGVILSASSTISSDAAVVATLRLPGGKGGFGSMLRAIGAQIEKTTNREACRDLSGRRLRDINEEKRLKDFISKKAEREREMLEKKRQKFDKLNETPKHIFQDESYYQQREIREKNLFDSLDKAFGKEKDDGPSGVKRSCESEAKPVAKIKKGRFLDDLDDSSDDSDSDEDSNDSSKSEGNKVVVSSKSQDEKIETKVISKTSDREETSSSGDSDAPQK